MTMMKIRDRENRKFLPGFRDMADFFTGNRDPIPPLVGLHQNHYCSFQIHNNTIKGQWESFLIAIRPKINKNESFLRICQPKSTPNVVLLPKDKINLDQVKQFLDSYKKSPRTLGPCKGVFSGS